MPSSGSSSARIAFAALRSANGSDRRRRRDARNSSGAASAASASAASITPAARSRRRWLSARRRELGAPGDQVVGRPPLRQQQAQHLLVDARLLGALAASAGGVCRIRLALSKSLPNQAQSPSPSPLISPEPGARAERRRVQVVDHDPAPRRRGLGTVQIGAQAGRDHLAELGSDAVGPAERRVAVLLHLRRERAAAGELAAGLDQARQQRRARAPARRSHSTAGLRRGVAGVEQLAVLDEQQAVDDQRRDRGEIRIDALGQAAGERDRAVLVQQREARPGSSRDRSGTRRASISSRWRSDRRACWVTAKPARRSALGQLGQLDIAEAAVVGAARRGSGCSGSGPARA